MKTKNKNPATAVSDWATGVYVRAKTAWATLREDDRGLTTLEIAVIATALLAVALVVAKLITDAVTNHSSTIK